MDYIKVNQGCSVMLPDNSILNAGQMIPCWKLQGQMVGGTETARRSLVDEWVRSGHVTLVQAGKAETQADLPTELPPGVDVPKRPPAPASKDGDPKDAITTLPGPKREELKIDMPGTKVQVTVPVDLNKDDGTPSEKPIETPPSRWVLDPADLQGLSLEQLNAMVLERDPEMPPFETVKEAVAQLSLDFKVS